MDQNFLFILKSKKYNITCERKFEIDKSKVSMIGFTSKGCFIRVFLKFQVFNFSEIFKAKA